MSEPSRLIEFQQLLGRALKSFAALSNASPGDHSRERDCQDALKVFSELWRFQQEHRATLVEAGLTRADIGEIASKIAQIYYNLYLRTSWSSWLLESYTFFEAIHTRAYFSSGGSNASVKQLKFYARFIIVCLLRNRKEEAWNLVQEFQALVSSFAMKFSSQEAQEWTAVVHSVTTFLNADVAMPMPRSPGTCVAYRPNFRCCSDAPEANIAPHSRRLKEVIMANYMQRQVKIAELPIDSFRMMLALEWNDPRLEMQGTDAPPLEATRTSPAQLLAPSAAVAAVTSVGADGGASPSAPLAVPAAEPPVEAAGAADHGQMVAVGPNASSSRVPESPYKRLLHRTTVPVLLSFLASSVLGLGRDEVLLLHLVGHGHWGIEPRAAPAHQHQQQQQQDAAWGPDDAAGAAAALEAVRLSNGLDREPDAGSSSSSRAAAPTPLLGSPGTAVQIGSSDVASPAAAILPSGRAPIDSTAAAAAAPPSGMFDGLHSGELVPLGVMLSPSGARAAAGSSGGAQQPVGGMAEVVVTPDDIMPFTRRQLMLVVDSDASRAFSRLGSCPPGCSPPLCLLSPQARPSALLNYTGTGAFFTLALTCPVMAFCVLLEEMDPSAQQLVKLEEVLQNTAVRLGTVLSAELAGGQDAALVACGPPSDSGRGRGTPASPWGIVFADVLLRRLVLRFVMIRAAYAMHVATRDRPECQPACVPPLPDALDPSRELCRSAILEVAALFGKEHLF